MTTLGILLLDSFRMLRSQKLFWIFLVMSGFVALIYASIGFNERGVSLLFGLYTFENEMVRAGQDQAKEVYMLLFTNMIVPYWLNLIAIILALISCSSIFPEFVRKGSIDLVLSKPPRRLTLFLWKYFASLLFVFLQVFLFTVIVFLSFGIRFGDWVFSVFWAVPFVVFVFSLIYCVHVFISVWSGSTIFGVLAAFLIWGLSVMTEWAEFIAYEFAYLIPQMGLQMNLKTGIPDEIEPKDNAGKGLVVLHSITNAIRTPMPKTRVTSEQLRRLIVVGEGTPLTGKGILAAFQTDQPEPHQQVAIQNLEERHPLWRDIGTSFFFEFVFFGAAAWVFCRRDY